MAKEVVFSKIIFKQMLSFCLKLSGFSGYFVSYLPPLRYPGRGDIHTRVVVFVTIRSGVVHFKIKFFLKAFLVFGRVIVGKLSGWS